MFSFATRKSNSRDSNGLAEEEHMRLSDWRNTRLRLAFVYVLAICSFQLYPLVSHAQNLGTQPATGQAVQGQTAAQPEGTVLNLVNWVGNVISPVGAALAVVMAVVSYSQGRGVARWAVTAAGLLVISGLTRLIEFWIQNGTAGGPEGEEISDPAPDHCRFDETAVRSGSSVRDLHHGARGNRLATGRRTEFPGRWSFPEV